MRLFELLASSGLPTSSGENTGKVGDSAGLAEACTTFPRLMPQAK